MSDRTPPPPRRRIAGETPAPAPAKKAPAPAKKPRVGRPSARRDATQRETAAPVASPARTASAARASSSPPPASPARSGTSTPPQVARPAARPVADAASRFTVATVAVAALVLVAGAVVGVLGFRHFTGTSLEEARGSAVTAASSAVETIFSYSYDTLDEHTTESKAVMTPSYATKFDIIAPSLTDIAPDRKMQNTAVVRNAAALPCGDECSASAISVLVFLDQDRRLGDEDTSTVFGNRVEVDMVKSDGEWLVEDIRAL